MFAITEMARALRVPFLVSATDSDICNNANPAACFVRANTRKTPKDCANMLVNKPFPV